MRTALIVATLFVVAASISAQRRPTKIDATDAAEVTQRAVRGRGRARFVKTPEFAQAVTEQERTTPKVAKKQNAPIARRLYEVEEVVDDIPETTRRIAKPRVITETKFEATNAPKTKLFEPAPVAAETAPPEESIKPFNDVPEKELPEDVDITTMQLEMDEVEKISSTSSSTTTTTTTPAPSTEASSSRRGSNLRRGQRPALTTESVPTAARTRTRVRTNRKQEDSSESTTSSSRTNFRAGRRRPEKETLRGRGPSILENEEEVSAKPRNERRTGSQRRKVEVSTTTEQIEPQKTRSRTSTSRGRKTETQAAASTRQPSRRRINTRPDNVKESVKTVEASTTPRPERSSRGRSRARFNVVDETKLEVLPLFEAEPKVVPRTSSRRGRTRAPVDEFVASSTVENPIRHAPPPTSTSRSVTISSRQNKITTETKQVTEKPITKETVQSEVSEVISTRKVMRRKKVEVKKKLLDRGTTKSEVQLTNVKSKDDSDEVDDTDNYPPQFKALIQAKTKEEKGKKASRIAHTERIVASVPTVAPKPSSSSTTPSRKERVTQRSTTASTTISTTTTSTTISPPTKKHTSTKSRKPLRYSTESVITPIKTVTANYPSVVPTTTGPPPAKKATTAKLRKPLKHSNEFENIPIGAFKTSTAIYPSIPPTPVITFRSSSQRSQPRSSLRTSQKPSSTTTNIPSTSSTTTSTTTTSTTTIRPSTAAVLPSSSPIPFNVEDDENELVATPKTPRRRFSTKRREYKPDAPLKLRIDQPEVTSKRPATRKTSGRYHARFVAKSEDSVEKTSPKPSSRPTFTRKSIKHEERKPIPRSNKIDGNTQLPQVTVKKANRYSSRYRGETRSTPVRASTATPVYVPTVPTITPSGQQVRGIQGELDGFPVISIDEPVNSLYSDNLISENATNLVPDGGKNDQSKPVSIIERIINSITSISTTTKPGEEKDGASSKGVTESSAILKIASKKPTLEQTTTKVAEVTTEKPTTIIERILSSLSAIQATDHVSSRINTEDADNEINAAEAATTKAAEATTATQAPTTEAATTTMKIITTTEAATTVKATEPAPITTTYRTTTFNPYTTTDLASFISQFLSTLRPVYTPTTTYVPTTFAPTTPFVSTTYNDNIIKDTAPTVTITARSRTTARLTTQPPSTTPIPTTTPMPTTTTTQPPTTTELPTTTTMPTTTRMITTTTEAPTTTPIRTTTTLPPTTTHIPSKRRLETTTGAPIRRRSTLPPSTTTYLPTTTYISTTTFVPTTKLGFKPEDVDLDDLVKKSNKKLSDQQLKDLEALKALEREQAAILKQLSFLTNLNFGGQQPKLTTKQPKLSTPSSLASRILSFAAERDKETTTTFRPPVETTTNPGVTIVEALSTSRQPKRIAAVDSKNEIESIIKQLNDNGVTSVTNPTIVSTYGKSQEAILAAILKERGIEPSTPKSLGDQIRQNHLFNEPTTTRRPRITTQRPPGRLAQGLNWILNALAPPPSTRRPKPKPRPRPVVVTTTEYEELIRESTDSTPVYVETTTRGKRPVNALSDAELANLIAQLEAIQKDPAKVRNLDLTPFKNLQNPTDQGTKNVEIISSGSSGSNKVTRAPKAYSGSQRIRASTINSIEEDPTTRPPRVVTTTQEVHTRPVTRGSRITLPPVSLDPVPGVNDNSPMVGGNFLNAAVNVTRAISTFLGSAIQGAAQSFQTMIGSGSRGVGGYFEGSRG
ncbi:PREDICTED: mucin-2-like [Nicrophorus vespilloides]|uniref:Mucin-2-like n=1 Tax=Nicrophorus vespilloides TaxID=110193 RepID=A0ABM1MZI0_NICVS|nr:PREDICTED: mucin-2-like [Nicrophorus vespilloides]